MIFLISRTHPLVKSLYVGPRPTPFVESQFLYHAVTHGVFPMGTMDRTCCFYDLSYQEKTQICHYVVTAGVNMLIDRCLRMWQQNICCHTVVTSLSRQQFVYFQLVMLKVWQLDGVTIKKQTLERSLFSLSCGFICCAQKYNKGVGWRNKDVSWQPYCIFRRNKDIGGGSCSVLKKVDSSVC